MMRISPLAALALACSLAAPLHAADIAAGKQTAEMCAACHGDNGISTTENIPSLAGQPDLYLQYQLIFFRGGNRKSEVMQPLAEPLTNDDVRNLGAYFASLMPPPPATPDDNPEMSANGAKVAVGRRCNGCHTATFAGTKAVARLAGQREEYLVKALQDYKSDARSGGGMAAMAEVAHPMADQEIEAVAHYLAHFQTK